MPWPALKGAVDKYRHNRSLAPSTQKAYAGLEGRNFSVRCAGAFRKKANTATFFEFGDDFPHRGQIRFVLPERHCIDRGEEPSEKSIGKQRIAGEEMQLPFRRYSAKYRVEKALMIAD